ncbi:MAG: RNA-directed DNA polymerase [Pirellulaceae bacterium]|jgi:RNA-directed DNA polymerase
MTDREELLQSVPHWTLRLLATNSTVDEQLQNQIDEAGRLLSLRDEHVAFTLVRLDSRLRSVMSSLEYDSAANLACAHVWSRLSELLSHPDGNVRRFLGDFALMHFPRMAGLRIMRRIVRDPLSAVRSHSRKLARENSLLEVAIPNSRYGGWDTTGWFRGNTGRMKVHRSGSMVQEKNGVPALSDVGEMRELLGIKSAQQLGYFLLSTDRGGAPTQSSRSRNEAERNE